MIHILQFGEGNFLRTFVEHYFDTLNEEGGNYGVTIIKPIPRGDISAFAAQGNTYHMVLRGRKDGKDVEYVREIHAVRDVFSPFEKNERFFEIAKDPELKIIVSNTTEAGICFCAEDAPDGFADVTYPAKLTRFLFARFEAGLPGLYMMPVELIDRNADVLAECVDKYITLWNLPETFRAWIKNENFFCNTLVDRIVSGYPKTAEDVAHFDAVLGKHDPLLCIGEPFGLWAVENKGRISDYIKTGHHGIDVVLADSIDTYKKQKVRVLNGSHTNLVAAGLVEGKITVFDVMTDEKFYAFVKRTLDGEIIPFVSNDIETVRAFASNVFERFANPYLNHQLISIALNSVSKWRARNLPSFEDYYAKYGKIPANMTVGFSYLMFLYSRIVKNADGKFTVNVGGRTLEITDDLPILNYFAGGGDVLSFMKKADVFGKDLTAFTGFADAVLKNMKTLANGESLI